MRILFEVLLIIIIIIFAYKAFGWLFASKIEKGREENNNEEKNIKNTK